MIERTPNRVLAWRLRKSLEKIEGFDATRVGAHIVKWAVNHETLDYVLHHMYVLKESDGCGHNRGHKTFRTPTVRYRDIYFYQKETRKALRGLISAFDYPMYGQIGFTKNKGIQNVSEVTSQVQTKTYVKLDLADAFNSITTEMIFWMLKVTFDVNRETASKLANAWTTDGHMLQGHPLAPLFFNLWTRTTTEYLNRIGRKQGFQIVQYADDIMICDTRWRTSWKQIKYIMLQYKKLGFDINTEKEGFYHKGNDFIYLGINFYTGQDEIQTGGRTKHKRRIRAICHSDPEGLDKHKGQIVKGIKAWLYNPLKPKVLTMPTDTMVISKTKKTSKSIPRWIYWVNPATLCERYRRALEYS